MTDPSPSLKPRPWVPERSEQLVQNIAEEVTANLGQGGTASVAAAIEGLIDQNRHIHDVACVNLNPATNTMNPAAEAALSRGLGTRTSLGYAGAKYEMGLEAIERIEIIAAELVATVFSARYAEIRVPSGAMANLYGFMACAQPGESIIVPPAEIAGHVTHQQPGAAGLYGLNIHEAPIDPDRYTIDVAALALLADRVRPKLISIGSSLNIHHHDVPAIRAVADEVGAVVLFDAAHLSGVIAGDAWPNPLDHGAHLMTMSTYKSLGGPTAGLLVTNEAWIAERVDAIAFPGMTANFDVGKTAALAITMLDWVDHGAAYANAMTEAASALADALSSVGVPVARFGDLATRSHAFAVDARPSGGGQRTAEHLRKANVLTSAIGLPSGLDDGLRVGTNELVRFGATAADMEPLADLISQAINSENPSAVSADVKAFRNQFQTLHYLANPT